MKREDYEWLVKILASVINAAERGNEISFHVTCSESDSTGERFCYLSVNQFRKIDKKSRVVWNDSWMTTENKDIFGDPEEIVKVVNAL